LSGGSGRHFEEEREEKEEALDTMLVCIVGHERE